MDQEIRNAVEGVIKKDEFLELTTAPADEEFVATHGLGRVPVGYAVIKRDKAGDLYDAGTPHDTANLYLKCSGSNVAMRVLVF